MHQVGEVLVLDVEAENFAVVIQELFLRSYLSTTEALFHEVSHLRVVNAGQGDLRLFKVVSRSRS